MYSFTTTVFDVVNNSSQIATLLQVIDVPNEPPMWIIPFATERFLEKTPQASINVLILIYGGVCCLILRPPI